MEQAQVSANLSQHFELRFASLFDPGKALSFPCDASGHVDMDGLSDAARRNYLAARVLIGRDYGYPTLVVVH